MDRGVEPPHAEVVVMVGAIITRFRRHETKAVASSPTSPSPSSWRRGRFGPESFTG